MIKNSVPQATLEINFASTFKIPLTDLTPLIKAIAAVTCVPPHVAISVALQVAAAGGVEAHAATMLPDSIWMIEIYPELRIDAGRLW